MQRFDSETYYRPTDAAMRLLAKSPRVLAQWRYRGRGPKFVRFGNRVLYLGSDLNAFLDANAVEPVSKKCAT